MIRSKCNVLIVLGKSGSGKGTQVEKLAAKHNLEIISSGALLRRRAEQNDFIGKRITEILAGGELMPTPIIFHLWLHELEVARENPSIHGVVFEGSPRKLYEARMMEETLWFYHLNENVRALSIYISDEEAVKRLLSRARSDDTKEAVKNRLGWFGKEVMPVISYYKEKSKLIEINGEQSIENVAKEIEEKTKTFFAQ